MKLFTGFAAAIMALSLSLHVVAQDGSYKVNTKESTIKWTGEKVTGKHFGNINLKDGSLSVSSGKITGGNMVMDMNSITCTDLEDAEWNGKLIGHLKSDDFFGTSKYPTANLTITKVMPSGKKLQVVGKLTIKGITKDIEFMTDYKVVGNKLTAAGSMTVNRTLYDIKYGSGSFFDDLGDKTIYDDFVLDFSLVANK